MRKERQKQRMRENMAYALMIICSDPKGRNNNLLSPAANKVVLEPQTRLVTNAVEFRHRANDQAASQGGRSRHAHFAESVCGQHFEVGAGLDYESVAVFAEAEYSAVVGQW